jgi:hypothetical protein
MSVAGERAVPPENIVQLMRRVIRRSLQCHKLAIGLGLNCAVWEGMR